MLLFKQNCGMGSWSRGFENLTQNAVSNYMGGSLRRAPLFLVKSVAENWIVWVTSCNVLNWDVSTTSFFRLQRNSFFFSKFSSESVTMCFTSKFWKCLRSPTFTHYFCVVSSSAHQKIIDLLIQKVDIDFRFSIFECLVEKKSIFMLFRGHVSKKLWPISIDFWILSALSAFSVLFRCLRLSFCVLSRFLIWSYHRADAAARLIFPGFMNIDSSTVYWL